MILPNLKIKAVAALALGGLPAAFGKGMGGGGSSIVGVSDTNSLSGHGHGHGPEYPPIVWLDPDYLYPDEIEDQYCVEKVGEGVCLDYKGDNYWILFFPTEDVVGSKLVKNYRISPEECATECGNRFGSRVRGIEWDEDELRNNNQCGCLFDPETVSEFELPAGWGYAVDNDGVGPIKSSSGPLFNDPTFTYLCFEIEKCGTGGSSKSGKGGYYDGKSGKGGYYLHGKSGKGSDMSFDYTGKSGKGYSKSGKGSKKGGYDTCAFENPLLFQLELFEYLAFIASGGVPTLTLTSSLVEPSNLVGFKESSGRRLARDREGRPGQIIKEYEESIATTAAPAAPTTVAPVDASEEAALGSKDPDFWLYIFLYHQGYANYVFGELLKDWVNKGASPDDIFEAGEEIGMAHAGGHGHGHGHRRQLHGDDGCEEICGQFNLYILQMTYTCYYDDFFADYANVAANFMDGFAAGVGSDLNVLKCPYILDPYYTLGEELEYYLTEETLAAIGSGGSGCDYHDHGHGHRLD